VTTLFTVASVVLSGGAIRWGAPSTSPSSVDGTAAAPDGAPGGFEPSALAQSTFSFSNDSLRPGNGQPSAAIATGSIAAAAGVGEVLVATRGGILGINASTGSTLWADPFPGLTAEYLAIDAVGGVAFAVMVGNPSEIVKIGLSNGSLLARTDSVSTWPIAFDPVSNLLYQSNYPFEGISTYYASNLTGAESLASFSGGGFNPAATGFVVDPRTGDLFVTSVNGWGQIVQYTNAGFAILSPQTGAVLNETYVCGPGTTGPTPDAMTFDSRNDTVFVLCTNATSSFLEVQSGSTASTVATLPVPEYSTAGYLFENTLAFVPATDTVVLGNENGSLTTVNATTYREQVNSTVIPGNGPDFALVQGGPNGLLYGIDESSNTVNAFDTNLSELAFSRQLAPEPLAPTYVDQRGELWVAGVPRADSVAIINTTLGRAVGQVEVGRVPDAMAYDPVHANMWIANALSYNVSVVSALTHDIVASVPLGSVPVSVVVVPSLGEVFIAESSAYAYGYPSTSTLAVINDSSFAVESTINLTLPTNFDNNPNATLPTTIYWDPAVGRVIVGDAYQFSVGPGEFNSGFWSIDPADLPHSATPTSMFGMDVSGLGYDPSTGSLYATGWETNTSTNQTLWKVNPSNGTFEGTVGNLSNDSSSSDASDTGAFGSNILPLSGTSSVAVLEATGAGYRLSLFNTSAPGFAFASYPVGSLPTDMQWNPSAEEIYVTNYFSESVSWFDPIPRVTVNLTATVTCGDFPELDGVEAGSSVSVLAPGAYPVGAVGFCGSSVFDSWGVSGELSVRPGAGTLGDTATLTVNGTGTVTANYLKEPNGLYPVVLDESGLPSNTTWTAALGSTVGAGNGSTILLAVANGTYDLHISDVSGYSPSNYSRSIVVQGVGALVNVTFERLPSPGPRAAADSILPLVALLVGFAAAGVILSLSVHRRLRSPRS